MGWINTTFGVLASIVLGAVAGASLVKLICYAVDIPRIISLVFSKEEKVELLSLVLALAICLGIHEVLPFGSPSVNRIVFLCTLGVVVIGGKEEILSSK